MHTKNVRWWSFYFSPISWKATTAEQRWLLAERNVNLSHGWKRAFRSPQKITTLHKTRLLDIMRDLVIAPGRSDRGDKTDVEKALFFQENLAIQNSEEIPSLILRNLCNFDNKWVTRWPCVGPLNLVVERHCGRDKAGLKKDILPPFLSSIFIGRSSVSNFAGR